MFLLIDNYDSFTFNLAQAFGGMGITPVVRRNDDADLLSLAQSPDLQAVCIGPGPGGPEQAGLCLKFLEKLPTSVPVLGVCLGHQILGRFAGAPVEIGASIMHGKASNISHDGSRLFRQLPSPMRVGRYHSLAVKAEQAKKTIKITARSEDGEVMALDYEDQPWVGVQFHPESVLTPEGVKLLGNFISLSRPAATEISGSSRMEKPSETEKKQNDARPPQLSAIIETLAKGKNLSAEMAKTGFARLMDGEMTPAQAGAFLLGLRGKGETPEEMAEAAKAVLERAVPVNVPDGMQVLDVVGAGGDGKSSFNCSTGTALILAALGHKVAKHGNRSISSRCGSADVLEGLGINLNIQPDSVGERLRKHGFAFLFAPHFHPSFRHIMPIRRELGVRTLFNLLGPLVNPARPGLCFIGAPDADIVPLLAETLACLGSRSGAVVHGAGGYDELTAMGEAHIAFVRDGKVTLSELNPAEYGFKPCRPEQLAVSGPEEGVDVLRELLDGRGPAPMSEMLALNVGFGLHLLSPQKNMAACMEEGRSATASGLGGRYLRQISDVF